MIREQLAEINEQAIVFDGFDKALIGYVESFGGKTVALYDRDKVIDKLIKDGITCEEAYEYFDFNIIGAYLGEFTPVFATILKER